MCSTEPHVELELYFFRAKFGSVILMILITFLSTSPSHREMVIFSILRLFTPFEGAGHFEQTRPPPPFFIFFMSNNAYTSASNIGGFALIEIILALHIQIRTKHLFQIPDIYCRWIHMTISLNIPFFYFRYTFERRHRLSPVSYTHLTLPTILLV